MDNYEFLPIMIYHLIKILHPALEFESPQDNRDLWREGRGKEERHFLSLEQSDGQERTDQKNKTSLC